MTSLTDPPGRPDEGAAARVLVVTAVAAEQDAVAGAFRDTSAAPAHAPAAARTLHRVTAGGVGVDVLAAGVGPAAAAATTATVLAAAAQRGAGYGLVVSTGIGGGFQPGAPLCSLVVASRIVAADLGAETAEGFVPVTGLGFGTVEHRPDAALVARVAEVTGARTGAVLTVSTVTGTAARATALRDRHPDALAEAMEGFGVAEAAAAVGCPVVELRAVSNAVGPRDREQWRIGDALKALTDATGRLAPVFEALPAGARSGAVAQ
ncbi:futalosine hydrolase [Streptomyces sp. NPDC057682]|uniref:futalosine hydrolase n=1 Tax=Streptomyces sp. NPDC057682 TaxID=3346210 RepID=UPI0036B3E9D6